jgi:hypothetical protein
VAAAAGPSPVARPLARWQAGRGPRLTSLRHETIGVDEFGRRVARLLDGTRDRPALLTELRRAVAAGEPMVQRDGELVRDGRSDVHLALGSSSELTNTSMR